MLSDNQMFTATHNSIAVTGSDVWNCLDPTPSPHFRTNLESVPSGMFTPSYAISDPITSPDEMSACCRECGPRYNILCSTLPD
jgi:hypothetical protein